jgi:hypothetical protein
MHAFRQPPPPQSVLYTISRTKKRSRSEKLFTRRVCFSFQSFAFASCSSSRQFRLWWNWQKRTFSMHKRRLGATLRAIIEPEVYRRIRLCLRPALIAMARGKKERRSGVVAIYCIFFPCCPRFAAMPRGMFVSLLPKATLSLTRAQLLLSLFAQPKRVPIIWQLSRNSSLFE